jgi:predicted enzyme related to lactoylglutathione lyase
MAGRFFWCELMTTDIGRSAAFFASLLDADILRPDDDSPVLFVARKNTESILFALLPIEAAPNVRSHWIGYLTVPDLDRALELTRERGGDVHVLPETEDEARISGEPRFAVITDPQGAVLNIHENVPTSMPENLPGLGEVAWYELLTSERYSSGAFYQELVGWEIGPAHERPDEGVAHALFHDGRVFGFLRDLPAGSPVPPHWAFYLRVPDLDAAIASVRALGGFMYEDPAQVDGGRRVIMLDPTGAPVTLWAAL